MHFCYAKQQLCQGIGRVATGDGWVIIHLSQFKHQFFLVPITQGIGKMPPYAKQDDFSFAPPKGDQQGRGKICTQILTEAGVRP